MGKPRFKKPSQKSEWEERFAWQIKQSGIVQPLRQYPFAKCIGRLYRSDFAWPDERLMVEINGGLFVGGRHSNGVGLENDMERNALASALGWRVIQFSPRHVKSGWACRITRVALGLDDMTREMTRAKEWR